MTPDEKAISPVCKHLGLNTDPLSLASYPSVANCCYGCRPENTPSMAHQREFCLTSEHVHCPVFQAERPGPMPREIVYPLPLPETKAGLGYQTIIGIIILVIVLVGGALLALLWPTLMQSASPVVSVPIATHTPEPTASETSIPATETPTRTATSTRTATPTLVPTATPQVVQLPLESILGTEYTVVLHRVIPGDSLTVLAQNYGTSDKAILDATYRLIMPLFVDRIIVIPYQIKNWKDLPPLEPYQITRQQTTLDEIAAEFGIDPALLKYHNGCENCVITEGSWIVLPRSR